MVLRNTSANKRKQIQQNILSKVVTREKKKEKERKIGVKNSNLYTMGEKNKKNKKEDGKEDGGGRNVTVVLKTDLHCEGCASKIVKCIRSFDDVETVSVDESAKITVVGKVDPVKLREKLEQKTHKKVELISPQPKKDNKSNDNEDDKENAKGKNDNNNNKKQNKKEGKDKNAKEESKSEEKKPKAKEPPVTTAVFKVHLHCQGCIQKIHKIVSKTKGYEDMKIDKQKDLVSVTGTMDMKAIADVLKKHLKRDVEIVPPKKEEKKENGNGGGGASGGGEKGKDGGGKEKGGGGGGGGKEKGGGGGGGADGGGFGELMEGNRMQVGYPHPFIYGPGLVGEPQFHYNPYPVVPYNAPQMFSDENPNACSIM